MKRTEILMKRSVFLLATMITLLSFTLLQNNEKPILYIIGDSTVQNNDGNGVNEYWGWGCLLYPYFDTLQLGIRNHAKSGTSTRTFISDGRWDKVLNQLKPGDFVIMQFGHNDNGPLDDTAQARGTLQGIGEENKDIINPKTKKPETVHTYGWYLRKFVTETKAKGATAIICSLVPREKWKDGTVVVEEQYPSWAAETAKATGACFIDLNSIIAAHWIQLGPDSVKAFFPGDHTHTNKKGAQLNAQSLMEGLRQSRSCALNTFIRK